jgi:tetratricopeptide (TPR) repeat protein
MKQAAIVIGVLALSICAWGQAPAAPAQPGSTPPAASQTAGPPVKRPPQAKTQPEYDAYKAVMADSKDPVAMEKEADDFAAKFPDSELRVLLFSAVMQSYQTANNAEKMMEVGRKVLKLDPDDPVALTGVAQVLAERTQETDLDKDQRYAEAAKLAQHALDSIDTVAVPAGTPQDKVDAYKGFLRSNAYYVLGTVQYNQQKYADAEGNLRKSIDAFPSQPDPLVVLRLALSLDKQEKYPEALKFANQAVQITQENTTLGTYARNERDRLTQLTGGSAAAPKPPDNAQNPPKK